MKTVIFQDLGLKDYKESWDYQQELFDKIVSQKQNSAETENFLLFCEHPNVYTLGRSGNVNNLLIQESFLKQIQATFYKIDRGGDITYHGPGQIVGYPILNLEILHLTLKNYIFRLEETIIRTLKNFHLNAERLNGATGVWLTDNNLVRKICAIGVKASRMVTMHGFAFNINTNLQYFNYINPCGFVDKGVTSLSNELSQVVDIEEVKNILKKHFSEIFEIELI